MKSIYCALIFLASIGSVGAQRVYPPGTGGEGYFGPSDNWPANCAPTGQDECIRPPRSESWYTTGPFPLPANPSGGLPQVLTYPCTPPNQNKNVTYEFTRILTTLNEPYYQDGDGARQQKLYVLAPRGAYITDSPALYYRKATGCTDYNWIEGEYALFHRAYHYICPVGTTFKQSPLDSGTYCIVEAQEPTELAPPLSCPAPGTFVGNPIIPATGQKYRKETDLLDPSVHELQFTRIYKSFWPAANTIPSAGLGSSWNHNHSYRLIQTTQSTIKFIEPEGTVATFTTPGGTTGWTSDNISKTLVSDGTTYVVTDKLEDVTYLFDSSKRLTEKRQRNGWKLSYSYDSANQLAVIANAFGKTLSFTWQNGLIVQVNNGTKRIVKYGYTSNQLTSVADVDSKTRRFLYEISGQPTLLTGIQDEFGNRWATFSYDNSTPNKAISTELAGGVNRYTVQYPSKNSASVTDPRNGTRNFTYGKSSGRLVVTGASTPVAGAGDNASSRTQSVGGVPITIRSWSGLQTTYSWDVNRLQLVSYQTDSTPQLSGTVEWHPQFNLPTKIVDGDAMQVYTYDALGRPMSRTISKPDGSDARIYRWTYSQAGLPITFVAPNGSTTTYTYDDSGNMRSVKNPLGHEVVAHYTSGTVPTAIYEPNGLVHSFGYDRRDRLINYSFAAQTSNTQGYTVLPRPDGNPDFEDIGYPSVRTTFSYDAAQRMTGYTNSRGEAVTYSLDNMGNRVAQTWKDSDGSISLSISESRNELDQVTSIGVGELAKNYFEYTSDGLLKAKRSGLNENRYYTYDTLGNLISEASPSGQLIRRTYTPGGQISTVTDRAGNVTTFTRNSLGAITSEYNADAGTRTTEYDKLGFPVKVATAQARTAVTTRDAIGRATAVEYSDGQRVTYGWDSASAGIGHKSSISSSEATESYSRDVLGRVTSKSVTLASGQNFTVGYSYRQQRDQVESVTYANAGKLTYEYGADQRISGVLWNGVKIISGITWSAIDNPKQWVYTFSNLNTTAPNISITRVYNSAGQLASLLQGNNTVSSYTYNAAGRLTSITQLAALPNNESVPSQGFTNAMVSWNLSYNVDGLLTGFQSNNTRVRSYQYAYATNGNRVSATETKNSSSNELKFTYNSGSNRISSGADSKKPGVALTFTYDNDGAITSELGRRYFYDAAERLVSFSADREGGSYTVRYAYNGLGQRIFKTEEIPAPLNPTASDLQAFEKRRWNPSLRQTEKTGIAYLYDENGTALGEWGSGGTQSSYSSQFIYLPTATGPLPVAMIFNGEVYAVQADQLNTPRRVLSKFGDIMWQWLPSGYGEERAGVRTNSFSSVLEPSNADVRMNLRLPGQMYDRESGLHYNYSRYYSPGQGRYLQRDGIGLAGGMNPYLYAEADPSQFSDPFGFQVIIPAPPVVLPGSIPGPSASKQLVEKITDRLNRNRGEKTYQTYTRFNPRTGECYSGRTSGYDDPLKNIKRRGQEQVHLNKAGFNDPVLDRSSSDFLPIWGREQDMIDANGGARSTGGTSRNMINSIWSKNPAKDFLLDLSRQQWGQPTNIWQCECR